METEDHTILGDGATRLVAGLWNILVEGHATRFATFECTRNRVNMSSRKKEPRYLTLFPQLIVVVALTVAAVAFFTVLNYFILRSVYLSRPHLGASQNPARPS